MQCPTQSYADVLVATAAGRIDFAGAQVLEGALAPALAPDAPHRAIVVDLSGVDYISSVGLRVLMVAAKTMRARRAAIAVASLQPVVAEIFEISRFHHVVDVREIRRVWTRRVAVLQRQRAVAVRLGQTVELGQRDRLDDREALGRAVAQVQRGLVAIQPVEQLPGGVAQVEEWPAVVVDDEAAVRAHSQHIGTPGALRSCLKSGVRGGR